MASDIAIVDYGAGNLQSVANGLKRIGYAGRITSDPTEILGAQGVILPGVGSSGAAMDALEARKLIAPLRKVAGNGTPLSVYV